MSTDMDGGNVGHELAEKLEISLTEMIERPEVDSIKSLVPNIIKVPADIRKGHDDAYVPKMFFIGPYHRKKDDPSPTEQIKLLYLRDLLARDKEHNKVRNYAKAIHENEKKARQQYSEFVDLDSEEFVKMLVIDGCFIIEFLLKRSERIKIGLPLDSQVRNLPTLRRDLLLLENQIPFFILDTILQKSNYNIPEFPQKDTTLLDLALHYLTKRMITKEKLSTVVHRDEGNIYHLLHLSYLCLLADLAPENPTSTTDQSDETTSKYLLSNKYVSSSTNFFKRSVRFIRHYTSLFVIYFLYYIVHVLVLFVLWRSPSWSVSIEKSSKKPRMLPTVTELKEAGVTFKKKKKKNADCYLDVSFDEGGNFRMPLLSIQENTDSTFRNFLAFEQSCPKVGNYFTSYVVLMDNLIDTPSDVAILKRRGLLESKLGSNVDVADLFNQMRSGLCFDFDHHDRAEMFQDINGYCNREHNRWRAKLMHDYFSNPWACLSIAAAVLLLGLTAVQTAYTVRTYYH